MTDLEPLITRYAELRAADMAAAQAYYFNTLLAPVVAKVREASAAVAERAGEVDLLVSMAGSSPMTTILAFEVLQPTEVVVLTSPTFKHEFNRIAEHIVGGGHRGYDQVALITIDPTDPVALYRTIRQEMERREAKRAVIDITGGKKVMSATAAMSAWLMDLPLAYVEGQWKKALGGPVPGTERLILLANPVTLFGDVHLAKAEQLFDTGAWSSVLPELERLATDLPDPSRARFLRDLARLYRAWSDLDLEAIRVVQRLGQRFPDFDSRAPAYERWGMDLDELRERVGTLWSSHTHVPWRGELPSWVGYGHAATLLAAVDDPLMGTSPHARKKLLGHLLHLGELRNGSILAHGRRPVTQEDAHSFDSGALRLLRASFQLEDRGDVDSLLRALEFIKVAA